MIRTLIFIAIGLLPLSLFSQNTAYFDYIDRYKSIAIDEMERSGVPASIKLGQGILESAGGTSTLALRANNHFGIKCGGSWKGKTFYRKDDDRDENGKLIKSCFRKFNSARDCYIAHSEFLRNNKRYDFLFFLNPRDYKSWSYGLKKAGYATSATYAEKLIKVIETYELYKLDDMTTVDVLAGNTTSLDLLGVLLNNDVKMVLANEGQTPAKIALATGVAVKSILKYNEKLADPNQLLIEKERIYIQKKRRSFRDKQKYHYVKEGDNMYQISQLYGIRLKRLYKRNRLKEGDQPAVGQRIKIRGWKVNATRIPKLRNEVPPQSERYKVILPDEDNDGFLDVEDDNGELVKIPPRSTDKKRKQEQTNSSSDNTEVDDFSDEPKIPAITSSGQERVENESDDFENSLEDNQTSTTSRPSQAFDKNSKYHYVEDGDNMLKIARMYGVSLKKLYSRNRIPTNAQPAVGEQIKLRGWKVRASKAPQIRRNTPSWAEEVKKDNPTKTTTSGTKPTTDRDRRPTSDVVTFPTPDNKSSNEDSTLIPPTTRTEVENVDETSAQYYTVDDGDTLYAISKKFGTTVQALKAMNGLSSNFIRRGMQLRVK